MSGDLPADHEPKYKALLEARSAMKGGATFDELSPSQRDAIKPYLERSARYQQWERDHPGVPYQVSTRHRLDRMAQMEVHEHMTLAKICEELRISDTLGKTLRKRYHGYYQDRIEAEVLARRQALEQAIEGERFASIHRNLERVKKADDALDEVLDLPTSEKTAFAKVAAGKEIRKNAGVDIQSTLAANEGAKLGGVLRDLIGIVRQARGEKPIEADVEADEAEMLESGQDGDGQ